MFLRLRSELAKKLKAKCPMKVGIGWIDLAVGRKGIDIDIGCKESCIERLNSYPFEEIKVMDLEEAKSLVKLEKKKFDHLNLEAKMITDALAYLYTVKEVYDVCIDFTALRNTISDLKKFGLATTHSIPKSKFTTFTSLSKDGYEIAKEIIAERIESYEDKIRKVCDEKTYLIAIGLANDLKIPLYDEIEFDNVFYFMKKVEIPRIEIKHPKAMFCEFLVKTIFKNDALKLAEEMEKIGLAFKVRAFTPYGDEIGTEYRFAREVVEFLMKINYCYVEEKILSEFLAVYTPLFYEDIYPVLKYCYEEIKKAEEMGLCEIRGSKIKISKKFEDYARFKLATIVLDKFIKNI